MKRLWVVCAIVLLAAGCSGAANDTSASGPSPETTTPAVGSNFVVSQRTPLVIENGPDVVPFRGSDGRYHLVWEVPMQNTTGFDLQVTRLKVTAGDATILDLGPAQIPAVLQDLGEHDPTDTVGGGQEAYAFLTASFASKAEIPHTLTQSATVTADRIPEPITTTGGELTVNTDAVVPVLGPPLEAGSGYLAGDGCCDSHTHIRAGMGVDGGYWFVQRYAIDWEQVNDQGQFVVGDPSVPENYVIYGKDVLAVADGTVVHTYNGLDDQVPGQLPGPGIPLDQADGNSIVLDIGDGLYVNYAHLKKGSLQVKVGDKVTKGEHIANVGESGNASAPHLHMHVMDGPSTFGANSRPYVFEKFSTQGKAASPEAWSTVENTDQPLSVVPVNPAGERTDEVPLNLWLVTWP